MNPRPLATLRLPGARPLPRLSFLQEAAVAIVLRGPSVDSAEVLLVRRAQRLGDPWSGHMALPGGRRDPADVDLLATAMRETHEEVGLALTRSAALGALGPVFTVAPTVTRRRLPMVVRPYVFALDSDCDPTIRASAEVTASRWVPLSALRQPMSRTTRPWRFLGVRWPAPAWDLDGDVVWGLTHQMLSGLLRALR